MQAIKALRSVVRFRHFERDRITRMLSHVANNDDLRLLAKRRLPEGVFDYIDGGAEDEQTLAHNVNAFRELEFRPRVLTGLTNIDTSTELFGSTLPIPVILAPTGFTRIVDNGGELPVARAAGRAGLPYTLSTLATRSIEEVANVATGRMWFQVYVWRDRGLVQELIERARVLNYEALVLTVDTPVFGRRERDVRRGFTLPPKIGFDTLMDGIRHPRWVFDLLRSDPITFANIRGSSVGDGSTAVTLADFVNTQFDPGLSWRDVEWLRSLWTGPIVLKGIQGVDDAQIASTVGVDAIALSNHGGRQLDGSPASITLVGPVVDALGGRTPVILDGGIRRGSDIVKAVALGATAVTIGRAYLYGLGAAGERGVDLVLKQLHEGMKRTMALIGTSTIAELNRVNVCWRNDRPR